MATQTSMEIPRPESGDVVEMILEDHPQLEGRNAIYEEEAEQVGALVDDA